MPAGKAFFVVILCVILTHHQLHIRMSHSDTSLNIPTLSLADFTKGDLPHREQFVQDLGQAYEEHGFVAIVNHSLTDELQTKLYDTVKQFFALDEATKKTYDIEGLAGQRGYTGKGKEHAKDRKVGDLKEFYHVGQEVTDGDPIKAQYPDNVWPTEIPEFKDITLEAYQKLEDDGRHILRAIALYLGLDETYFDDKIHNGNSILRPIHYFPLADTDIESGAVRASAHEDINLITLLMGASAAGWKSSRNRANGLASRRCRAPLWSTSAICSSA